MEFFIQNIGWFVGIGLVLLLALIGYFADKREQKKLSADNNTKNVNPDSNNAFQNKVVNNDLETAVPDVVNSLDSSFINDNGLDSINISSEELNNNKADIIDDQFKNIEDTHMSLADLENKNYNEILNSRDVPEYNYVDDNEISNYVSSQNIGDDVMSNVDNISNISETNSIISVDVIDNQDISENDSVVDSTNFDDVTSFSQGDTVQSTISNEINGVTEEELFNNEVDLNTSVPELVDSNISSNIYNDVSDSKNEDGVLDLYNDSLDDDIWKF